MYTRLLIPVDGFPPSEYAAKVGLVLAKRLDASVVFATVCEAQHYRNESEALTRTQTLAQTLLEHWEREAKGKGLEVKTVLTSEGNVAEALLEVCKNESCDLIVLGTHGRTGVPRVFLGSVAERVARLAQVPVLLVRGDKAQPGLFKHILLATDGSACSEKALEHADYLANVLAAKLTLLNVAVDIGQLPSGLKRAWMYTDTKNIQERVDEYIERLKARGQHILDESCQRCQSKNVTTLLRDERYRLSSEVIQEVADEVNAELIVMGSHGYTGLRKFLLGSVASEVAHHAKQPVLLVRNLEASKKTEQSFLEAELE